MLAKMIWLWPRFLMVFGAFVLLQLIVTHSGRDTVSLLRAEVDALTKTVNELVEWRGTGELMRRPGWLTEDDWGYEDTGEKTGVVR